MGQSNMSWGMAKENRFPKECIYCGGPAEGISFIPRHPGSKDSQDAAPLCNNCASEDGPTDSEVWVLLAAREDGRVGWQKYKADPAEWWRFVDFLRRRASGGF